MDKPHLTFLEQPTPQQRNIISILEQKGRDVEEYASELFKSIVVTTVSEENLISGALYILASEIRYDYRALVVETKPDNTVIVRFFTLVTQQPENKIVDVSENLDEYEQVLNSLLSSDLFNASLKFLTTQIGLKREYAAE